MNRRTSKRIAGAVSSLALAILVSGCFVPNGKVETLTIVGSDTTQDVMQDIVDTYNAGGETLNQDGDIFVNVLSQQSTPVTAPADDECGALTYATPAGAGQVLAPNGSSNGRNALRDSVNNGDGCVDIARSSSTPRSFPSDNLTFEYYAFALDAVGWASGSSKAPANLSLAQLRGIYNCTYTNWNQVGGTAGPIQRYIPQAGSGTRSFFESEVLGFNPSTFSNANCPVLEETQENSGLDIAADGAVETAISPYSVANWIAQANDTAPDQRAGQELGGLGGQAYTVLSGGKYSANPTIVNESQVRLVNSNPTYPGVRFVFNVVDSASPSYDEALRFVGFDNSGTYEPADSREYRKSSLCSGAFAEVIENKGFTPLDETISPTNTLGSTCRQF